MFCQKCGAYIADGTRFCPICGERQDVSPPSPPPQIRCPFCVRALEPDSVFCEFCGRPLTGQPAERSSPAANAPGGPGRPAPFPAPPVPGPDFQPASHRSPEPGRKNSKALLTVILILMLAAAAFAVFLFRNRIRALFPKGKKTVQEGGITATAIPSPVSIIQQQTSSSSSEPAAEPTPEPTAEPTPEPTLTPTPSPSPSPSPTPTPSPSPSPTPSPSPSPEPTPGPAHDPLDYETFDVATLADFQWVTYDIAHGILPSGMERLEDFEEIEGGWKLYLIDDPDGQFGSSMERLCRCAFGVDANGRGIGIRWDYVHDTSTDTGYEESSPDSFYYGSFESGVFDGLGPGSVRITDFWVADGHEYAVGKMIWPDGVPALMFLVRP